MAVAVQSISSTREMSHSNVPSVCMLACAGERNVAPRHAADRYCTSCASIEDVLLIPGLLKEEHLFDVLSFAVNRLEVFWDCSECFWLLWWLFGRPIGALGGSWEDLGGLEYLKECIHMPEPKG